jgi:hypothetical protein
VTSDRPKHPGGRPTKRTPEIVDRIAEAISYGLTNEDAACLVGISDETLERWFQKPQFCGVIKRAVVERKLFRLKRIESGEEGWPGTAWCMERQYPREWSRPDIQFNQQINVQQVTNVDHPVHMIPQSELLEMLAVVARVDGQMELEAPLQYDEEQATPCQPV